MVFEGNCFLGDNIYLDVIKIILGFYKLFRKWHNRSILKTIAALSIQERELEDSTLVI